MNVPQEVRCTHVRPNSGIACRKLLTYEFAGFLRTKCPRCDGRVVAVTTGRTEIEDGDGVIVVTVAREPRSAARAG